MFVVMLTNVSFMPMVEALMLVGSVTMTSEAFVIQKTLPESSSVSSCPLVMVFIICCLIRVGPSRLMPPAYHTLKESGPLLV